MRIELWARILGALALTIGVGGCGGEPGCGVECVAPLTCEYDDSTDDYACRDMTTPSCRGWPEEQVVPFSTTDGTQDGRPLHWAPTGECVVTSYDSSAIDLAELFATAVASWNAVACSELCLSPPIQMEALPTTEDGERRMHLTRGLAVDASARQALPTVFHSRQPGHIRSVHIQIANETVPAESLSTMLHLVGLGLGLGEVVGDEDSVMVPLPFGNTVYTAPTALDEEALCVMYGSEPYCPY